MGLFSKKKKTYVNTSVSRLIEDRDIPELGQVALFDYLYANNANRNSFVDMDKSYSTHLIKANANSISSKLRGSRRWAENNYTYGIPEASAFNAVNQDVRGKLEAYLQEVEGKTVQLIYGLFMPANALHIAYQKLIDNHGYDFTNNTLADLTTQLGTTVYLEDIQIHYCKYTYENLADPETVMQYGLAATHGYTPWRANNVKAQHTAFVDDPNATKDFALVSYSYLSNGNKTIGTFEVDFLDYEWSGLEPEEGLDDSDTDNIDPDAIAPITTDEDDEKDYIIAQYYVKDDNDVSVVKVFTYEYDSSTNPKLENLFSPTRMVGKFYPNIYLRLYGTNLASEPHHDTDEFKASKKYCLKLGLKYQSISDEIHKAVGSLKDVTQIFISTQLQANSSDPLIQEYMFEYFYALYSRLPKSIAGTEYTSLNKNYINGYSKPGMTISISDRVYSSQVSFKSIGYVDVKGSIGEVGTVKLSYTTQEVTSNRLIQRFMKSSITCHVYRKQLTEDTYRELTVYGLSSSQRVGGGKSTTATGKDSNLYIPLDDTILVEFLAKEKTKIVSKSLIVMINTLKVVKQKWYETSIFKIIMFVIAVVVSVVTGGQGMTLYAIAYATVQAVAVGIVLNIAIKFLVKTLDINLGALFAIVAVVLIILGAGAYIGNGGSMMGMTSAQFMQAANYSIQISSASNQLEISKMIEAQNKYSVEMEAKMKELAELEEEMNPDKFLSAYYLMSDSIRLPDIRVGEIMNDFIARTLSVDAGLAPLSLIPNMVNLTVQLPTFQQTHRKIMALRSNTYDL